MRILLFSFLLSVAYITYERITSYVAPEPKVQTHIDPIASISDIKKGIRRGCMNQILKGASRRGAPRAIKTNA